MLLSLVQTPICGSRSNYKICYL